MTRGIGPSTTRGLLSALVLGALSLGVVASGGVAHAQRATPRGAEGTATEPTERARQLFERGLASLAEERWDEARVLFEEAWSLSPRPSILVNLGTAQRQSGRLVEARASYQTFLERFATHELAARTRASLAEVEALLPRVTIHVEGLREGDEVFLDDEAVPSLAAPFAANPGLRQVSLWRDGRVLQSVRVRVELEGNEEVFLRAIELAPAAVAATTASAAAAVVPVDEGVAAPTPPPSRGDDTGLVVGLVIGAVLVVGGGVALGVVLGAPEPARAPVAPTIRAGVLYFE